MNLELTTFPENRKRTRRQWLAFVDDDGEENEAVNLYPELAYQTFEGFGGAFTDSAGYVFSLMSKELQQRLLNAYFGPNGARYTLGRLHLDSCDFSLEPYTALSDPNDRSLASFSLERSEKYLLPLIRAAQKTLGKTIPLMAAPWSPPAFMKTNEARAGGGSLKAEYRSLWAEYLCTYLVELRKRGFDLRRMTIQNEPNATQTWDSCVYTAEEEKVFLRDFLIPALRQHKLDDMELFIWDHNKERVYERARDVLDETLSPLIAGIAFHWYSGDHFEALHLIQEQFPGKKMVQSEACIEYRVLSKDNMFQGAQKYAHDIIGDLNAGMSAFYDWNLVLDEEGGPNHVKNFCDAPFLYHTNSGLLEERPSFSYISHFSRFIRSGARRIAFSRYTDALELTAFRNPDESIAAVFLNRTRDTLPINLRVAGKLTAFHLPPQSIATATLPPE
jgi:glucosylceramidase